MIAYSEYLSNGSECNVSTMKKLLMYTLYVSNLQRMRILPKRQLSVNNTLLQTMTDNMHTYAN